MMGVKLVLDSSLKMVTVGVNDGHQGLETKISFPKMKYSGGVLAVTVNVTVF